MDPQQTPPSNEPQNQSFTASAQTTTPQALPGQMITGSSLATAETKRNNKKRRILITLATVIALPIMAILVLAFLMPADNSLTLSKYDNHAGSKFKLMFYNQSRLITPKGAKSQALEAPDIQKTGAPLVLWLTDVSQSETKLCDKPTYKQIYEIKMTKTGETDRVCALAVNDKPLIYFMQFTQNDKKYLAVVMFNTDGIKTPENAQQAQQNIEKVDFSSYDNDLKIILASIEAL